MFNGVKKKLQNEFDNISVPNTALRRETAEFCRQSLPKRKNRKILRPVTVSFAAVLIVFAFALAASADFRDIVISFFKSSGTEVLPPNPNQNETIAFMGRQSVEGIAEIQYFELNGAFSFRGDVLALRVPGGLEYYGINGGGIKKLEFESTSIFDTVRHRGIAFPLALEYGTLNGKPHIENALESGPSMYFTSVAGRHGPDQVWLVLGVRQGPQYYVLYDLKKGETTDIIGEMLGDVQNIRHFEISPDGEKIIVGAEEFFILDIVEKKAESVHELLGLDEVAGCTFVDNSRISVLQNAGGTEQSAAAGEIFKYHAYGYDLKTGERTVVFENGGIYNSSAGTEGGYIALGRGVYLMETRERYILIDPRGKRFDIPGIRPDEGFGFLLSPDGTKIAVMNSSGEENGGLGITELGLIDIPKRELKIFERKDFNKNQETGIFWSDENTLAVTAKNQSGYLYLYQFKAR